jgi:alpha-tubulin suppressor-like RCC1 family protein
MAAGTHHSCARLDDGTVSCWGNGSQGQLGDGSHEETVPDPRPTSDRLNAAHLRAGANHTCIIDTDGDAWCWGNNNRNQLGLGAASERVYTRPQRIGTVSDLTGLTGGFEHSCAWSETTNTAHCWGRGELGMADSCTYDDAVTPRELTDLPQPVADMAAGRAHTCAIVFGRAIRCFGDNTRGQLGDGTRVRDAGPVAVTAANAVGLAAGDDHTCAWFADDSAACWGVNDAWQIESSISTEYLSPQIISGLSGIVGMCAGAAFTCAWLEDGTARCWGDNSKGQLGNGTTTPVDGMWTISFL